MSLNLYYFYCNFVQFIAWFVFPKHFFFFLNTKRLELQKYTDVEVSKTHIRYDTLPRLKMVIE